MITALIAVLAVGGLFLLFLLLVGVAVVAFRPKSRVAALAPAPGPMVTEDGPPRTRAWQRELVGDALDDLYLKRARNALLEDMIEAAGEEQIKPAPKASASKAKS